MMMSDQDETILEYLKHLPERLEEARRNKQAERDRHLVANILDQGEGSPKEDTQQTAMQGQNPQAGSVLLRRLGVDSPTTWLFFVGMLLYLITRFVEVDKFPIYFFSDEAIQTLAIKDLIQNGLRDSAGRFLPLYFNNGGQYNLSLSVYLQTLVAWLPNSVWATRVVTSLTTVVFPLAVALSSRDHFKLKHWWLAPFVISALPAWFLHSRTAFETCLGASMYALFLYFYLRYRHDQRSDIIWTVLFGALAFYAYAPLQLIIVLTAVILLIVDFHYHIQSWAMAAKGLLAVAVAALPYFVFRIQNPQTLTTHLHLLDSYWLDQLTLFQKIGEFLKQYLLGLDPTYWFISNSTDLVRHQMQGYAPMGVWTLPLVVAGLVITIRKLKEPAWRVVLIALLAAPAGAALAQPTITRLIPVMVPLSMAACIGLDWLIEWLDGKLLWRRSVAVFFAGVIGLSSLWMAGDALVNGPKWFSDYGLYGMQWGGEKLFGAIEDLHENAPEMEIILSPTWANATDVLARFFLGDPLPIRLDTIQAWGLYYLPPLDESKLFVMTPEEFTWMRSSVKFTDWSVRSELLYPDGTTGFYFVTLRYADNVEQIFAQELADRKVPVSENVTLLGQEIVVKHSPLDIGGIAQAFDGDTLSIIRGFEANPLEIKLEFLEPVRISSVTVYVGAPPTGLVMTATGLNGEVVNQSAEAPGSEVVRPLKMVFARPIEVTILNLAISNLGESEPAHVHVWEVVIE